MATTRDVLPRIDRDAFAAELDAQLSSTSAPIAVAMADLDDFASVNTTKGHAAGDAALQAWDRALQANVPKGASIHRIGGDEFAVILPSTSAETAVVLMEEIRTHFGSHPIEGVGATMSASVGIASRPPHGATADELWRAADEALMRAKRDGRDRVAMYVEEKMTLKSNYYSRANLDRLAKLSSKSDRTEASLLREALDDLLDKYRDRL
jgi:diguanylate cyclase